MNQTCVEIGNLEEKVNKTFPLESMVINIFAGFLESLYRAVSHNRCQFPFLHEEQNTVLKGIHDLGFKSMCCLGKPKDGCAIKCIVCGWNSIVKPVIAVLKPVSVKILKPTPPNFPSWKPQGLQICLTNLTADVLRLPVRACKVKVFLTLILLSETLTKT